jgi:hypothetical protein
LAIAAGSTAVIIVVAGSSLDETAGVAAAICPPPGEASAGAEMRIVASGGEIGWVSPWLFDLNSAPHDPQVAAPSLTPEPQ